MRFLERQIITVRLGIKKKLSKPDVYAYDVADVNTK